MTEKRAVCARGMIIVLLSTLGLSAMGIPVSGGGGSSRAAWLAERGTRVRCLPTAFFGIDNGFSGHLLASAGEGDSASASEEEYPAASVGHFLGTLKKAIPWVLGAAFVLALILIVVTCWLRQGIFLQDLMPGRGRRGVRKLKDPGNVAAKYLERLEKRQAERQGKMPKDS